MPTVEPSVDLEKLASLLQEAHESESLDYKAALDLSDRRARIELAKDVGAMQARGGYIVVGATDNGEPTGLLDDSAAKLLDEARLRPILEKWIPAPLEIRTQTHCLAGNRVVGLIYVAPRPDGFCIFKADGTYEGQDRRQHSVFRAGDIYVRRGTSSEPWRQEDVERIIRRLVDFEKESWRAERTRDLEHHISGAFAAASIAKSPIGTLSWDLDSETFARSSLEILRAADEIVVREFTSRAAATCLEALLRHDQSDTVGTIIDRLTLLVALGVYYDKPIGDALPLSANMPETVHLIPITEQGVYVGDHGHRIEIRWYIRDPGHAAQRRGRSQASTTKFHGSLQASGA